MTTGATMGGRRVGVALAIVALLVNLSGCGDRAVPPDQQVRPKLPMALSAHASAQRSPLATAGEAASPVPPDHPVEYRLAPGVEAPARSAAAYRLLPEEVDRQRVARLARALGLEAGVQGPDNGIFTVVSGTTRLVVEHGRWDYVRDAGTTPSEPPVDAPCQPGEECPPPPEPAALVSIPSASEAEDKAREFLSDAGIDVQGADTVIGEEATFRRTVTFVPQAGGRRVLGLQTSLTFGDHA
ncbi:MAG: hypothetical protein KY439_02655 [Actinobacteria bacterium]|nr:hypothetical protein [Actinomycetota bacterium]